MSAELGVKVEAAMKARRWSLEDVCELMKARQIDTANPGTLSKMLSGKTPGPTAAWGVLWEVCGLPLRDLYKGLGLPVPAGEPGGTEGEIMATVRSLPEPGKRLVLLHARQAFAYLAIANPHYETLEGQTDRIQQIKRILRDSTVQDRRVLRREISELLDESDEEDEGQDEAATGE